MPILGVVASSIAKSTFTSIGSYEAIASYTVPTGGVSSIVFSGIPNDGKYKHLQLRITHNQSTGGTSTFIALNGDTTTGNYARHVVYGDGTAAFTFGEGGTGDARSVLYINTAGGVPSATIMDFTDYANTSKTKVFRTLTGKWRTNSDNSIALESHLWNNTNAINSITLTIGSGTITEFSKFSLYGVKG